MSSLRMSCLGLLAACGVESIPLNVGDVSPDFSLEDVNETSPTFGQSLGPSDYDGQVVVWYFGHANCSYCSSQFGVLDTLHEELSAEGIEVPILGINGKDYESANATITDGRDIPWLQDTDDGVWKAWGAAWRDTFVVDADGTIIDKRSLTGFDLTDEANYDAYKAVFTATDAE